MSERLTSLDALEARLVADGVEVQRLAVDRLVFGVGDADFQSTAVVVWPREVALLQLMVPLGVEVPEARRAEVCEAVVRMNHLLVLPGFGLDLAEGLLYFRTVQSRDPDGAVDVDAVKRLVQASVSTASRFGGPLVSVVQGELEPADLDLALRDA